MRVGQRTILVALTAVLMQVACSTMHVGRNFDYSSFAANVKPGTTGADQVVQWLGPPVGRGIEVNPDGSRLDVWTYYYGSGKVPSGSDTNFKMLQVKLDSQGKVAGYVWTGDLGAQAPVEEKSSK
jgi:hypothetical protein